MSKQKKIEVDSENVSGIYQEVSYVRSIPRPDGKGNMVTHFDRLKVIRPCVKITPKEAAINNGVVYEDRNFRFTVYLKPGEELEPYVRPLR